MGMYDDEPNVAPQQIETLKIRHWEIDKYNPPNLKIVVLVGLRGGLTTSGTEVGFFLNHQLLGTAVCDDWGQAYLNAQLPDWAMGECHLSVRVKGFLLEDVVTFEHEPMVVEPAPQAKPQSPSPIPLDLIEKLEITQWEIDRKIPATLSVSALVSLKNGLTAPGIEVGFFVKNELLGTATSNEWGQVKFSAPWTLGGEYQLDAQIKGTLLKTSIQLNSPFGKFGHYTAYDDGTVIDTQTGLMWMRCALGQTWNGETCQGEAETMNWETACQQKGDGFAGYTDWRIPMIEELKTLVDMSQSGLKLHPQLFPFAFESAGKQIQGKGYWSGSPYANYSDFAWGVGFGYGSGSNYDRNSYRHVRLVRGGQ